MGSGTIRCRIFDEVRQLRKYIVAYYGVVCCVSIAYQIEDIMHEYYQYNWQA